jgi:hypothetical protein
MEPVVGRDFPNALLKATAELFKRARVNTMQAANLLNQVVETEAWKSGYTSFSEFVEEELKISKGHASKILSVYRHYVLEGGVLQAKLEDVDSDKLYLAIKLEEPVEKKVEIAKILTRRELKEEKNEIAPHEHQPICRVCHIAL